MKKSEIRKKIQTLLESNDDANFKLALILARQNNLNIDIELYPYLAKWVEENDYKYFREFSAKQIIQHFQQLTGLSFGNRFESSDMIDFPEEFMVLMPNLEKITYWNLHSPIYINIPDYFQDIPKLKKISISGVKGIHSGVEFLNEVEQISLSQIEIIPQELYQLPQLRELHLANEHIQIEDSIINLINLNHLTLIPYSTLALSSNIANLKNLRVLRIGECDEQTGYISFGKLKNIQELPQLFPYIQELSLAGLEAEDVTQLLKLFPNLQSLSLEYITFDRFPASIKEMNKLEALHLVGVNENCIPEWVSESSILKTLKIDDSWKKYLA